MTYRNRAPRCEHGFYDGLCLVCHIQEPKDKLCNRCGFVKKASAFNTNGSTRDGRAHYCRVCARKPDAIEAEA